MTGAKPFAGRYARRMRYPGENAAGRGTGRRHGTSGRITPPGARPAAGGVRAASARTGGATAGGKAAGDASLFAPGYSGRRAPGRDNAPAGTGWYGPPGGAAGKGPIRGFPPAPGQPAPLYPPGQFAAWNRAPQGGNGSGPGDGDGWQAGYPDTAAPGYADAGYADAGYADAGYPGAGYLDDGYAEAGYGEAGAAGPGYSALAVSDPSADVTSTQSWESLGDRVPATGPQRAATGPQRAATGPQRAATGPQQAATGPFDLATPAPFGRPAPAPFDRGATSQGRRAAGPGGRRAAAGPGAGPGPGQPPGRGQGARGHGSRGRKRRRGRGVPARALVICGLALVVAAAAGYFLLALGHKPQAPAADAQRATPPARPSPTDPSPSPSPLGQWGHIETRALDPVPLTLAELFPASFTDGTTSYLKTVQKAKVHCAGALVGSQLIAAVGRADCTQAMRASYLSSSRRLMGTIGVLNLVTATAAEQAGKAAGPAEYIAQLPAAKGPTKNLARGTGFEAAEVKGHYLVLVWAEFADLRAPSSAAQRAELEAFISLLMQKTANVSLATRQVTGSPPL
jgi:hypothetical protein